MAPQSYAKILQSNLKRGSMLDEFPLPPKSESPAASSSPKHEIFETLSSAQASPPAPKKNRKKNNAAAKKTEESAPPKPKSRGDVDDFLFCISDPAKSVEDVQSNGGDKNDAIINGTKADTINAIKEVAKKNVIDKNDKSDAIVEEGLATDKADKNAIANNKGDKNDATMGGTKADTINAIKEVAKKNVIDKNDKSDAIVEEGLATDKADKNAIANNKGDKNDATMGGTKADTINAINGVAKKNAIDKNDKNDAIVKEVPATDNNAISNNKGDKNDTIMDGTISKVDAINAVDGIEKKIAIDKTSKKDAKNKKMPATDKAVKKADGINENDKNDEIMNGTNVKTDTVDEKKNAIDKAEKKIVDKMSATDKADKNASAIKKINKNDATMNGTLSKIDAVNAVDTNKKNNAVDKADKKADGIDENDKNDAIMNGTKSKVDVINAVTEVEKKNAINEADKNAVIDGTEKDAAINGTEKKKDDETDAVDLSWAKVVGKHKNNAIKVAEKKNAIETSKNAIDKFDKSGGNNNKFGKNDAYNKNAKNNNPNYNINYNGGYKNNGGFGRNGPNKVPTKQFYNSKIVPPSPRNDAKNNDIHSEPVVPEKVDMPSKEKVADNENGNLIEADKITKGISDINNTISSSTDEAKNEGDFENAEEFDYHEDAIVEDVASKDANADNNDSDAILDDSGRGDSGASNHDFHVNDFRHILSENSEALSKMFGDEENIEKFKIFLKLMELSGGMEIFCAVFDITDDQQHNLPSINPHFPPLSELSRLPREKLEKTFRQLKRALIQSYNSRIFFPNPAHQQFYAYPEGMECHQQDVAPLSIISAPSAAATSRREPPTQNQIARRLAKCATAATAAKQFQQQQHQQQVQVYVDPSCTSIGPEQHPIYQQYLNHSGIPTPQQHQAIPLPPPPPPPSSGCHGSQQQPQQQQCLQSVVPAYSAYYLQSSAPPPSVTAAATGVAPYHGYQQYPNQQPSSLPLVTTTYNPVDFAQYLNQRNLALLDELRANEATLSNLLYSAQ